jgi:hypothetical protein
MQKEISDWDMALIERMQIPHALQIVTGFEGGLLRLMALA